MAIGLAPFFQLRYVARAGAVAASFGALKAPRPLAATPKKIDKPKKSFKGADKKTGTDHCLAAVISRQGSS
jgi:hypothetical protein